MDKEATKKELTEIRERLIKIRDEALVPPDFCAEIAVGVSHAIRDLHFAIEEKPHEEAP